MKEPASKVRNFEKTISPIIVIGGFLGSGKTTLLKRLLRRELDRGVRPGVLMNEFGETDIDAMSLADKDQPKNFELWALLSGCMCCDLSNAVNESLRHLLGSVGRAPIFIETTGLACTEQVVKKVQKVLNPLELKSQNARVILSIVIVDTPRFETVIDTWSHGIDHLRNVDIVILNKMDKTRASHCDIVERRVREINSRARILRSSFVEGALEIVATREASLPELIHREKPSTAGFRSVTARILSPIDLERFEELLNRYKVSLVRTKGFVHTTGCSDMQEIQWVPGALEVKQCDGGKPMPSHINVIGRRIVWKKFLEQLDSCMPRLKHLPG